MLGRPMVDDTGVGDTGVEVELVFKLAVGGVRGAELPEDGDKLMLAFMMVVHTKVEDSEVEVQAAPEL